MASTGISQVQICVRWSAKIDSFQMSSSFFQTHLTMCSLRFRRTRILLLGLFQSDELSRLRLFGPKMHEHGGLVLGEIVNAGLHNQVRVRSVAGSPGGALSFLIDHAFDRMDRAGRFVVERAGDY